MKHFVRAVSYILVAAIASCATLFVMHYSMPQEPYSKIEELKSLIDAVFIDEADMEAAEDAAAAAMVYALGDRWSYYMTKQEYQE